MNLPITITADTAPIFLALRDLFSEVADEIDSAAPGTRRIDLYVVTSAPVSAIVPASPVKPKAKRKPYSAKEKAVVLAKVRRHVKAKSRAPIAAVAAETGVTHPTVQKWARAAGLVK